MQIGKVVGKVVSTAKYPTLVGIKLNLVRVPYDNPKGKILIAADSIRVADVGDIVYLVDSTEGASAFRRGKIPVDLAIVGLVDKFYRG